MFHRDGLRKAIAMAAIFALVFQMDILMNAQSVGEIERQFQVAKNLYNDGKYDDSRLRIGRLLDVINEKGIDSKYIRAQCYLILGAICEQESNPGCAEENYRIAGETGITKVDGVNLDSLELYRKIVKGEVPPTDERVIVGEGTKKKKKFPWLLVAGGVVVVAVAAILLLKKKKKQEIYTLTVTKGDGVTGNPDSGSYRYNEGVWIDYNYEAQNGYTDLEVKLDGQIVGTSGRFEMYKDHKLEAAAVEINQVEFQVNDTTIELNEGGDTTFLVRLTLQPETEVFAKVRTVEPNSKITVISGGELTFYPLTWDNYQSVKIKAEAIDNIDKIEENIEIYDVNGVIPTKSVNVIIYDSPDDYNGPKVEIISPSDGDEVTENVDISVNAGDTRYGIEEVEFFIDNASVDTDPSSPYSYQWKIRDFEKGAHVIKVVATNKNGDEVEDSITVNVNYNDPPTVQIISPQDGATVSGVITIKVEALDDDGIAEVRLRVNDDPVQTLKTSPYYFELDTNALNNGTNFIKVIAKDNAGLEAFQEIEITVDNRE